MTARLLETGAGTPTDEPFVRRCALAVALVGLVAGASAPFVGNLATAQPLIWAAATAPVLAALAFSIVGDALRGRIRAGLVRALAVICMTCSSCH